ncbi:EAL domain-containing protein [Vibrio sp. ZSDE26]|uniref:cyclic-guanylate-specific phosphodiesterase n=1 Tax=Vibrio amylolyticus TaxID=2847292 RepID=A0A9X2BID6_9VIBR|nr:EAL domain-containing protein [Vibrio amylolyticus]MCK6263990.1 EAL domain-containing protein [Vibrio amylolyticus]
MAGILNFYATKHHAIAQGKEAIGTLEQYIGRTAQNLRYLNTQVSTQCNRQDVLKLREHTFQSTMIKEVGLYQDGNVFCTSNEGKSNISLYSSTIERLNSSDNNITISLKKSKSELQTFFIYAHNKKESHKTSEIIDRTEVAHYHNKNSGINALLSPTQFLELVSPMLSEQKYGYQITVLSQTIQSKQSPIDSALNLFSFSSYLYPLSITLHLSHSAYLYYFIQHLWQILLTASALSVIYLIAHNYRLTRESLEYSLQQAIQNKNLELYLQPIVDIMDERVAGSEALIRWHHPLQGIIQPDVFIPLAERMGIIDQITKVIIKSVTKFIYRHPDHLEGQYISINISRQLVIDSDFIKYLIDFSKRHPHIVPTLLLEITENSDYTTKELEHATTSLKLLSELGFKIAVDDFGTGYSGLNFIHQHPFNVLKIDKVFINGLRSDTTITPVLESMIHLGEELNMKVIAEGVETHEQLTKLNRLGIRYIQGYYFSKPMKLNDFIKYNVTHNDFTSQW